MSWCTSTFDRTMRHGETNDVAHAGGKERVDAGACDIRAVQRQPADACLRIGGNEDVAPRTTRAHGLRQMTSERQRERDATDRRKVVPERRGCRRGAEQARTEVARPGGTRGRGRESERAARGSRADDCARSGRGLTSLGRGVRGHAPRQSRGRDRLRARSRCGEGAPQRVTGLGVVSRAPRPASGRTVSRRDPRGRSGALVLWSGHRSLLPPLRSFE